MNPYTCIPAVVTTEAKFQDGNGKSGGRASSFSFDESEDTLSGALVQLGATKPRLVEY